MADELSVELDRLVDRLRSMPLTRLASPWQGFVSRAAAARSLAQRMADESADLAGWPRRPVPDVGDAAVGDQIAVIGRELLELDPPHTVLAPVVALVREARVTM